MGISFPPRVRLVVPSPTDSILTPKLGSLVSEIERHLPPWLLDVWSLDNVDDHTAEHKRVSRAPDQESDQTQT